MKNKTRTTEDRVKDLLKQHRVQTVNLTDPIIDGFVAAWKKPGYGPAANYVRAAHKANRLPALAAAALEANRLPALVGAADKANRLPVLVRTALAAAALEANRLPALVEAARETNCLPALVGAADDKTKNEICDAMGIE